MKAGRLAVQSAAQAESGAPLEGSGQVATAADVLQANALVGAESTKIGSKRAIVLSLMEREEGATIEELMSATGWLAHTTRAALSGLRKKGLAIVRSRVLEGQASVYRIDRQILAAAA